MWHEHRKAFFLGIGILVVGLASCESGPSSQVIAGRHVERVTERQGLSQILPIPFRVFAVYYVYKDQAGNRVRHGPYKNFGRDGKLEYEAFYRDGRLEGTATRWNSSGQKAQQQFWRMGQEIGWANYDHGQLSYELQDVYEDDIRVAQKKYEHGRWVLSFFCGHKVDQGIDPSTGNLVPLQAPFAVACQ